MSTQAKVQFSVRVPEGLVAWADEYAARMRWDRTTVVVAALESFREDVGGGVPGRPGLEETAAARPVARAEKARSERRAGSEKAPRSAPVVPPSPRAPLPAGVVRGSDLVRSRGRMEGEPNVDDFAHTADYREAMRLWRAGDARWETLKRKRGG